MAITLDGTTGITSPDINVTAQTNGFTTTGNLTAADLTLSGGVYLGGTGAANYLDDYEEGTWTPTLHRVGASSLSYTTQVGLYTKVGNVVHVTGRITIDAVSAQGSSVNYISGAPFVAAVGTDVLYAGSVGINTALATVVVTNVQLSGNDSNITFHQATNNGDNVQANWVASGTVIFSLTYKTDA
jgi:hypothetical protein